MCIRFSECLLPLDCIFLGKDCTTISEFHCIFCSIGFELRLGSLFYLFVEPLVALGLLVVLGDVRMLINRRFGSTRVVLDSMVEMLDTFSNGWPSMLVAVVILVEQNPSEF